MVCYNGTVITRNLERMNSMKIKKASKALLAAGLGTVLLLGSALADMVLGSGYGQMKETLKTTTKHMAGLFDSYTVTGDMEIKIDGTVIAESRELVRHDLVNRRTEGESRNLNYNGEERDSYYYMDDNYYVSRDLSGEDDTYYAHMRGSWSAPDDPFDDKYAADLEKIADAAVGQLADVISVENTEEGKVYSGHLTDAEIPALPNALAAFAVKYNALNTYPYGDFAATLTENVYVESVSGKAVARADGVLESGVLQLSVCGTDQKGNPHTLSLGLSIAITDINGTVIPEFDAAQENVEISEADGTEMYGLKAKHEGTYQCDIVKSDREAITKIGECTLYLEEVGENGVSGSFTVSREGSERVVSFTGEVWEEQPYRLKIHCTEADGSQTDGVISLEGEDHILRLVTDVKYEVGGWSSSPSAETYRVVRVF